MNRCINFGMRCAWVGFTKYNIYFLILQPTRVYSYQHCVDNMSVLTLCLFPFSNYMKKKKTFLKVVPWSFHITNKLPIESQDYFNEI